MSRLAPLFSIRVRASAGLSPVGAVGAIATLIGTASLAQDAPSWTDLGPFFAQRCTLCHSGSDAPLGLHLDSYKGAMTGSQDGPVLIPGDPEGSELIRRVRGISQPQMPPIGDMLTEEEIGHIEAWILAGLPEGGAASSAAEAQANGATTAPAGTDEVPATREPPVQTVEAAQDDPAAAEPTMTGPDEPVTFADVERIFLQRCVECHSDAREGGPPEGLRLGTYELILQGGERLVLIPGSPEASEIVRRIEGTAQPRMPFDGPPWLESEQIELIRRWIEAGAPDAESNPAPVPVGREVRYRGVLTGPEEIDGIEFRITSGTRVDGRPGVGQDAEVRGVVAEDGGIDAARLRDQ